MTAEPAGNALDGRRVVITGAARGLGRSLSLAIAAAGGSIVLSGREMAGLHAVAATILARTRRAAEVVRCDLAEPQSIDAACQNILEANPTVDVLINNAAPWLAGGLAELSQAEIVATVAGGLTGTLLMTRGLLAGLIRSPAADIVTIVSTAGLPGPDPAPASTAFHAIKQGQAGFCETLRTELKPLATRVAAIFPGDFENHEPIEGAPDSQAGGRLTDRDVVAAVLFAITAPRNCCIRSVVLESTA